ncbi:DsrE family protein [Neiella sp. HB171785]|uniref:DsrE family protein n=1 Tax=Neiella litorisoli TaxID=2771431 RepID=A0A8J6QHH4_9GAMM|nr:DsrE family protein [Neiella litorisoli]MBD1388553.1 DsrE family protein [Neiella litorisoli]
MIVIWSTQPAIGSINARETLDAALAFAAYDQQVSLLFSGQGVRQLVPTPNAADAGAKNLGKLFNALPLFDIDQVYIAADEAKAMNLNPQSLIGSPELISNDRIRQLLLEATHVIRI